MDAGIAREPCGGALDAFNDVHDLAGECDFQPAHWQGFLKVNRKFARVTARTLAR